MSDKSPKTMSSPTVSTTPITPEKKERKRKPPGEVVIAEIIVDTNSGAESFKLLPLPIGLNFGNEPPAERAKLIAKAVEKSANLTGDDTYTGKKLAFIQVMSRVSLTPEQVTTYRIKE